MDNQIQSIDDRIEEIEQWAGYGARTQTLTLKVTEQEYELFDLYAKRAGFKSRSDWIRHRIYGTV